MSVWVRVLQVVEVGAYSAGGMWFQQGNYVAAAVSVLMVGCPVAAVRELMVEFAAMDRAVRLGRNPMR